MAYSALSLRPWLKEGADQMPEQLLDSTVGLREVRDIKWLSLSIFQGTVLASMMSKVQSTYQQVSLLPTIF